MYSGVRMYNTTIHFYDFDPKVERIDADFGQRGKLEKLSNINGKPAPDEEIVCKVNASFFDLSGKTEHYGTYVDEGLYYTPPSKNFLDVIFTKDYKLIIKNIPDLKEVSQWQRDAFWVIAGSFSLVLDGRIKLTNTTPFPHYLEKHPRTAIGQDLFGNIILAVADGRTENSKGLTGQELADVMLMKGCVNAINLDGGGSSEMIYKGEIINHPSDGAERSIGVGLLVYAKKKEVTKMKVYISPSTQENNIGAGKYGTEEAMMNRVADLLIPKLKDFEVFRNKPEMTLSQVIDDSNAKKPDIHVAIHSNAMGADQSGKARGCEVWIYKGSVKGRPLAEAIYKELEAITPSADRGIKETTGLWEVAKTNAPACIVEIAFHDNVQDAEWIFSNLSLIADRIAAGIYKYAGKSYAYDADWKTKYDEAMQRLDLAVDSMNKASAKLNALKAEISSVLAKY